VINIETIKACYHVALSGYVRFQQGPSSSSPILCVSPHFPLIHNVRLLLACRISPWSSCTDLAAIGRVSGVWYGTSEHALWKPASPL